MSTTTQEDLMAQMIAGAPAGMAPIGLAPMVGTPAVTAPVQTMMAPVPEMAPVQTAHQNVGVQPTPEQMAAFMASQNPVMAPTVEQVDTAGTVPTLAAVNAGPAIQIPDMPGTAPVAQMTQPVAQAQQTQTTADLAAVAQNIGTQMNIQNGLNLDAVMTPEEQVKLEAAEVVATPITIGGLESIGNCKTSVWSALITILDFIAKGLGNNDIISIDKGTIDTQRSGIFVHCDMRNILGNISLNLTSPDASVKLLKLIKGGELVQIFKEEATNSYIFCNIQDSRVLTRVKTSFAADQVEGFGKAPILGNPVFQKEIPNNEKEIIKTIIAGKAAIGGTDEAYRFGFSKTNGSLVSIGVGKDFTHYFQDSNIEIDEYKCYNPFPVPNMESCIIRFFRKADDNTTWIQTVSNINPSSIICTENVELIDSSIEDFNFA